MIVLDTSAWLKRIKRNEHDVAKVDHLIERHLQGKETILIPYVAWFEICHILTEKWKLPWQTVRETLDLLWQDRLRVAPVTHRLLRCSTEIGEVYGLSNPDTFFVALATLRNCNLITADEAMFKKMRNRGIRRVRLLRDYSI